MVYYLYLRVGRIGYTVSAFIHVIQCFQIYKLRLVSKGNLIQNADISCAEGDIPSSIEDFHQRLQELIDKYVPVNPQNLAEELRNLQKAFEDSQEKLKEDVRYLKNQVEEFAKDLIKESAKREEETNSLSNKLDHVEGKIEGIAKENILYGERLANMSETLKNVNETTGKLHNELIGNKAVKKVTSMLKLLLLQR